MKMDTQSFIAALFENGFLEKPEGIVTLLPSLANQNLLFKVREAARSRFIKIYPASAKHEFDSELKYLNLFKEAGLAVPACLSNTSLPIRGSLYYVLVVRELEGKCLEEVLPFLSQNELRHVSTSLLEALSQQKTIYSEKAGDSYTLQAALDKTKAKFNGLSMTSTVRDVLDACYRQTDTINDCKFYHYVTHDWRTRHVFIKNGVFSGLLDFEYVRPNDFALEIGHFLHDIRMSNLPNAQALAMEIIEGLPKVHDVDDVDFAKRVKLYMTKQALAHIAAKLVKGEDFLAFQHEFALAASYCVHPDLPSIFNQ